MKHNTNLFHKFHFLLLIFFYLSPTFLYLLILLLVYFLFLNFQYFLYLMLFQFVIVLFHLLQYPIHLNLTFDLLFSLIIASSEAPSRISRIMTVNNLLYVYHLFFLIFLTKKVKILEISYIVSYKYNKF